MKITLYSEYALRTMITLGLSQGKRFKSGQLAELLGASQHHLNKVVQQLSRLGVTKSIPGIQGGVELLMTPENINLGWILRNTEPKAPLLKSVSEGEEDGDNVGTLKQFLEKANLASYDVFDNLTLQNIIESSNEINNAEKLKPEPLQSYKNLSVSS